MSTILFDITFNLLLDYLKPLDKFGYAMKKPVSIQAMRKAYADDLAIITKKIEHNQKILNKISMWLSWSRTMRAKPSKCRALAASTFTAKTRMLKEPHSKSIYSTFDSLLSR